MAGNHPVKTSLLELVQIAFSHRQALTNLVSFVFNPLVANT